MGSRPEISFATGILLGGKYQLGRKIGEGGMGSVWEATHVEIGRKVAIKTLHKVERNKNLALDRFRREAQMAGSIGHDHICEVTDIGTGPDGSPFLVMPLLIGCSLSDLMHTTSKLPIFRVTEIVRQTLSALQAAHGAKIVHRDLKPDNIFITTFGERSDVVKLLDFGVCKLVDQDPVSRLTQSGTILGTPYYMAPEQAKGYQDLDNRVDLYAMGVIMYEALTGVPPFNGASYNEVMFKIIDAPLMRPRDLNPAIPPEVEAVILKAMDRDRENRYQSAIEMLNDLDTATGRVATGSLELIAKQYNSAELQGLANKPTVEAATFDTATAAMTSSDINVPQKKSGRIKVAVLGATAVVLAVTITLLLGFGSRSTRQVVPGRASEKIEQSQTQVEKEQTLPSDLKAATPGVIPATDNAQEEAEADAGAAEEKQPEEQPEEQAGPPKKTSSKKKKKGKKNVKGRFGTNILSDYGDD